jgi:hypothetical protein
MGVVKQTIPNQSAGVLTFFIMSSGAVGCIIGGACGDRYGRSKTTAVMLCVSICLLDDHRAYSQRAAHLGHGHRRSCCGGRHRSDIPRSTQPWSVTQAKATEAVRAQPHFSTCLLTTLLTNPRRVRAPR